MAAAAASLNQRLSRMTSVCAADLTALIPMVHEPLDPRKTRQGSSAWLAHRHGRLTASNFASTLGFFGKSRREQDIREMSTGPLTIQSDGSEWGQRYERSALATYLINFVRPRFGREARVLETGFWPIRGSVDAAFQPDAVKLGASPDALLDGADTGFPGGVVLEVKCPYAGGSPRPQGRVHPRRARPPHAAARRHSATRPSRAAGLPRSCTHWAGRAYTHAQAQAQNCLDLAHPN